jgi:hypothetical protein
MALCDQRIGFELSGQCNPMDTDDAQPMHRMEQRSTAALFEATPETGSSKECSQICPPMIPVSR